MKAEKRRYAVDEEVVAEFASMLDFLGADAYLDEVGAALEEILPRLIRADNYALGKVAADVLRGKYAVDRLACRYFGAMPIDENHGDEETESSIAMRKATERATTDLHRLAAALAGKEQ